MSSKKRNAPSTPTSTKSKKPKTSGTTLDAFFKSSRSLGSKIEDSSSPGTVSGGSRDQPFVVEDEDHEPALLATPVATSNGGVLHQTNVASGSTTPSRTRNTTPAFAFGSPSKFPSSKDDTPPEYPDLGVDPLLFSTDSCPWPSSKSAPYSFLAHVLRQLSQTKSRILLLNILTNALRFFIAHDTASITPSLYIISNSLAPSYVPTELGLGPSVLSKALQSVSGLKISALRTLYHSLGDPGDVAYAAKASVRTLMPHPPLSIVGVYASLVKISKAKGAGTAKQRQSIVEQLLLSAKGEEVRYIMRTLSQNLRVGAVRTTILTALARATALTRSTNCADLTSSPSSYLVSEDILDIVQPLPDKKGKKKSDIVDEARNIAMTRMTAAESLIKMVFVKHPCFDNIVEAYLSSGLESLAEKVPLTVGTPLLPTLGSPTRSLDEIYARLGTLPFAAEFKYDGQRAQVHAFLPAASSSVGISSAVQPIVKIFSRHLEDMTEKYPDVVVLVREYFSPLAHVPPPELAGNADIDHSPLSSLILDAEIVAWDTDGDTTKSFQELSNRARKDVQLADVTLPVCLFVFDLMYLNSKPLLSEPFRERRQLLRTRFVPRIMPTSLGGARLRHVESMDSDATGEREDVETFWEHAVESRCEGLMVKLLDSGEILEEEGEDDDDAGNNGNSSSPRKGKRKTRRKPLPATYEPDKRTSAWLKLKKDYVDGIGDSLDLVPIGAWRGNGRKAAWWSPILLAVWDEPLGRLVAVCKCMSGFTDTFYKALNDRYPENSETCSRVPLGDYEVGGLRPSVYFSPREVWEIRGAEITVSPVSVAALGSVSDTRGLSLRFPRFMRVREDKSIEQATRSDVLAKMWRKQASTGANGTIRTGVDEGELVDAEILESEIEEDDYDA